MDETAAVRPSSVMGSFFARRFITNRPSSAESAHVLGSPLVFPSEPNVDSSVVSANSVLGQHQTAHFKNVINNKSAKVLPGFLVRCESNAKMQKTACVLSF